MKIIHLFKVLKAVMAYFFRSLKVNYDFLDAFFICLNF